MGGAEIAVDFTTAIGSIMVSCITLTARNKVGLRITPTHRAQLRGLEIGMARNGKIGIAPIQTLGSIFDREYPHWREHEVGGRSDEDFYNRYHHGQGAGWQQPCHGGEKENMNMANTDVVNGGIVALGLEMIG